MKSLVSRYRKVEKYIGKLSEGTVVYIVYLSLLGMVISAYLSSSIRYAWGGGILTHKSKQDFAYILLTYNRLGVTFFKYN